MGRGDLGHRFIDWLDSCQIGTRGIFSVIFKIIKSVKDTITRIPMTDFICLCLKLQFKLCAAFITELGSWVYLCAT